VLSARLGTAIKARRAFPSSFRTCTDLHDAASLHFILSYDVFLATRWPVAGGATRFGIGIGTLVMLVNVILLASYTFGCHSCGTDRRNVDCFSCAAGKARFEAWRGVSAPIAITCCLPGARSFGALTDVYIRLWRDGVIHDLRLF